EKRIDFDLEFVKVKMHDDGNDSVPLCDTNTYYDNDGLLSILYYQGYNYLSMGDNDNRVDNVLSELECEGDRLDFKVGDVFEEGAYNDGELGLELCFLELGDSNYHYFN
ncbi:MAG: hypothetical protein EZS28_019837, partial [Streblomastix strix]